MGRRPVISDLEDFLAQLKRSAGDIVVVPSDDDVQAPGDYVSLRSFFVQFEEQQEQEDQQEQAAASSPRPT